MRTKLIIAVFLVAGAILIAWLIKYQYERIISLESQKNELELKLEEKEQQLEKEKQDALEKSKRIQELNKIIKENPASANYGASAIDGALLDELRKQYLSKRD